MFALLHSCSGGEAPPDKQQARQLVESNLRRIGTPVKNINILDAHRDQPSGVRFYCFEWNADWVWDYPKGSNKEKVYGYIKFVKATEGWKYDHLNYKEGADPNVKCES
jgi:hypothetical protein